MIKRNTVNLTAILMHFSFFALGLSGDPDNAIAEAYGALHEGLRLLQRWHNPSRFQF